MRRQSLKIARRVVITLADSPRIAEFQAQAGGDKFEVFAAFDGRTGAVPPEFDAVDFERIVGLEPTGGEIGCAVSHFRVISDFAEGEGNDSDLLLVAEDDARLSPVFEETIKRLLRRSHNLDIVNLAPAFGRCDKSDFDGYFERTLRLSLLSNPIGAPWPWSRLAGSYHGTLWGTALYLISRCAAREYSTLVAQHGGIGWRADDFSIWPPAAGLHVTAVRPSLAGRYGPSSIEGHPDAMAMSSAGPRIEGTQMERLRSTIALRTRLRRLRESASVGRDDMKRHLSAWLKRTPKTAQEVVSRAS
jgi:GR25 family glycosyltransferase involved in LPS biosynthesis